MTIKFLTKEEVDSCRDYLENVPKMTCECGLSVPNQAFLMYQVGDFDISCGRCGRVNKLKPNPFNAFNYAKLSVQSIFDPEPWMNSEGAEFIKRVHPVPQCLLPEPTFTDADALKLLLGLIKGMVRGKH